MSQNGFYSGLTNDQKKAAVAFERGIAKISIILSQEEDSPDDDYIDFESQYRPSFIGPTLPMFIGEETGKRLKLKK